MRYLVLGDVHAEYGPFKKACDYAVLNNLHILSVGDLIDNGPDGYKVCKDISEFIDTGWASVIWGNHEWKIHRWLKGNDVVLGPPNLVTTKQMEEDEEFKNLFQSLVPNFKHFMQLGDKIFIAHAGMHPSFWSSDKQNPTKEQINYMIFGQADYSKQYEHKGQTYPHRIYDWTEYVPEGVTLIVGHDPAPMSSKPTFDVFQSAPTTITSPLGGKTIFTDCGAGKGGHLFGVVVNSDSGSVEETIDFSK